MKIELWGRVGTGWGVNSNTKGKGKQRETSSNDNDPLEWNVLETWELDLSDLVSLPRDVSFFINWKERKT